MNILTPDGYIDISTAIPGTEVVYYDLYTGERLVNEIIAVEKWDKTHWTEVHEPEDAPPDIPPDPFTYYVINGTWRLFKNQSVWRNLAVCHVKDLQVGDVIYDDDDNDITITSIEEVAGTDTDVFWWFSVSRDHSYIVDNITLHNASRYAKAAGGNWSASATWSATSSAGSDDAGAPTASDDVIFDSGANTEVVVDTASCAAKTLTCAAAANSITFTATKILAVSGNVTFYTGMTITGTGTLRISVASCTLNFAEVTFPGTVQFYSYGGTITLANHLRCAIFNNYRLTETFSGAYNIYCDTFYLEGTSTIIIPAGQSLNISTSVAGLGMVASSTIRSGTASSPMYLNYEGSYNNWISSKVVFTDVDASGSAQVLDNWYGGTLTRCTNIVNRTSADFATSAQASSILSGTTISGIAGTFDESARNTDPGEVNVKTGTSYKIQNVTKNGSYSAGGGGVWMPRARQIGV